MSINRWMDKDDVGCVCVYVCIRMCVCVYIYEYYSAIKKNEIIPFAATQVQTEIIILSEVRKRKTNTIWHHLYVESKIWHKWTYLWNRKRLTYVEGRLVVAKGEWGGGGMDWEFGVSRCKLLHIEWINNKVLLYSTGNYIQYPGINQDVEINTTL